MGPMVKRRVLVVEDDFQVGLDIETTLSSAGFEVVGPLMTVDEAMERIDRSYFDVAVLDANLNGQNVGCVAEALTAKRVPFAVVSGYAREFLPLALSHAPLIPKPFEAPRLLSLVQRICA